MQITIYLINHSRNDLVVYYRFHILIENNNYCHTCMDSPNWVHNNTQRLIQLYLWSLENTFWNHESISPMFYEQLLRQYSFAKRIQSQTVSTKKLLKTLLYKKAGHKMLMKLTPSYTSHLIVASVQAHPMLPWDVDEHQINARTSYFRILFCSFSFSPTINSSQSSFCIYSRFCSFEYIVIWK